MCHSITTHDSAAVAVLYLNKHHVYLHGDSCFLHVNDIHFQNFLPSELIRALSNHTWQSHGFAEIFHKNFFKCFKKYFLFLLMAIFNRTRNN